jgi:hypothetical protein
VCVLNVLCRVCLQSGLKKEWKLGEERISMREVWLWSVLCIHGCAGGGLAGVLKRKNGEGGGGGEGEGAGTVAPPPTTPSLSLMAAAHWQQLWQQRSA